MALVSSARLPMARHGAGMLLDIFFFCQIYSLILMVSPLD